jgi:hypothetical protein
MVTAQQCKRHKAFQSDVAAVWVYVDNACLEMGMKHKKTMHQCLDAVFFGARLKRKKPQKVSKWRAFVSVKVKETNESKYLQTLEEGVKC